MLFYVYECLPTYIHVSRMHAYYLHRSEEGVRYSGTGFTDGCESICWYWEPNPGSLQEQVLLITEPTLHPQPLAYKLQYKNRKYACVEFLYLCAFQLTAMSIPPYACGSKIKLPFKNKPQILNST